MKLSLILSTLALLIVCLPLQAAESAIIKYSIFTGSVSIPELTKFSETGELSPALAAHLRTANQNPEEFRRILNQKIEVDPVFLSKILNSVLGEGILDYATEVIHTPSKTASRQALRGALVTSALGDKEIQLIEVLENYPTSEVYINGDRLLSLLNQINGLVGNLPKLPF